MYTYLVFAGEIYYPRGGFSDLKLSTDNELEAMEYCSSYIDGRDRWAHYVNTETGRMITYDDESGKFS